METDFGHGSDYDTAEADAPPIYPAIGHDSDYDTSKSEASPIYPADGHDSDYDIVETDAPRTYPAEGHDSDYDTSEADESDYATHIGEYKVEHDACDGYDAQYETDDDESSECDGDNSGTFPTAHELLCVAPSSLHGSGLFLRAPGVKRGTILTWYPGLLRSRPQCGVFDYSIDVGTRNGVAMMRDAKFYDHRVHVRPGLAHLCNSCGPGERASCVLEPRGSCGFPVLVARRRINGPCELTVDYHWLLPGVSCGCNECE